jgi:large subunit ribosomal protein L4
MPEIEVKDRSGKTVEKIAVSEKFLPAEGSEALLHEAVVGFLANQRQGTSATKTKGLVRGGGRKPYRQKKTGRARAGSIRSPLWRKGGTIFGPQPRDYSFGTPKGAKRAALNAAITKKMADGEIVVIDSISMERPKTKEMVSILDGMGIGGASVLLVLPERDKNILLSSRNIPNLEVALAGDLNAYDVIRAGRLLLTKDAFGALRQRIEG